MPLARISPTLSRYFFLSFIASGRSSGLHPISSHSCCMYVLVGRPMWGKKDVYTSAWDLKRQYKVCNFGLKAETHWSLKQTCQLLVSVLRPLHYFTKRVPRRKICANSLWLYSYNTQSSPTKNKNINYIFIYLRVLRCLCSGSICDIFISLNAEEILL